MNSACATCRYFNLNPNDRVLLCMPLTYIAGKMMVVRALVGKLEDRKSTRLNSSHT